MAGNDGVVTFTRAGALGFHELFGAQKLLAVLFHTILFQPWLLTLWIRKKIRLRGWEARYRRQHCAPDERQKFTINTRISVRPPRGLMISDGRS